jgi:hypothetical protein
VETGNVILVVLDGVERHGQRKVGQAGVHAVHLIDRHLVLFEVIVVQTLLENADEEVVGEGVLLGKTNGRDSFEATEEGGVGAVTARHRGKRMIGELVVVAVVSDGGCALRRVLEIGLVDLFEEGVLGGESGADRRSLAEGSCGGS